MADEISPLLEEETDSNTDKPNVLEEDLDEIRWFQHELHERESMPWNKRPSTAILSVVMFFFGIFVSMSGPANYKLLIDQVCRSSDGITSDEGMCESPESQAIYSNYRSWSIIVKGITCSLVAGKVGQFSDMYGRKKIFILMSVIMLASDLLRLYFLSPNKTISIWGLLLSDFIVSLDGGGLTGFGRSAESYISDIEPAGKRIGSLNIIVGFVYGGASVGPLISNLLFKWGMSEYSVFKISAVFGAIYVLFTTMVLPESRSKMARIRSRSQLRDTLAMNEDQTWKDKINILKPIKILYITEPRRRRAVYPLMGFLILILINGAVYDPLFQFVAFKLHITAPQIGTSGMIAGGLSFISLLLISPLLVKYLNSVFKAQEKKLDMIDFSVLFIYGGGILIRSLLQCWVTSITTYFVIIAVQAVCNIGEMAISSAIVKYFDRRNSGQVYGAVGALGNMLGLLLDPFFLYLYKSTYGKWTNFVFVMNASIQVISIPLLFAWFRYVIVTDSIDSIEDMI